MTTGLNCIDGTVGKARSGWRGGGGGAFVGFLALLREEPRKSVRTYWVQRFFPYLLLRRRYAATQSPPGVTMAFRGELNRAVPCATNTGAFFTGPCTGRHTRELALVLFLQPRSLSPTHTHTQTHTCPRLQLFHPLTAHSRCEAEECDGAGLGGTDRLICRLSSSFPLLSHMCGALLDMI